MADKQEDKNRNASWEKYQADLEEVRKRVATMSQEERKKYESDRRHLQEKWDKTAYY